MGFHSLINFMVARGHMVVTFKPGRKIEVYMFNSRAIGGSRG